MSRRPGSLRAWVSVCLLLSSSLPLQAAQQPPAFEFIQVQGTDEAKGQGASEGRPPTRVVDPSLLVRLPNAPLGQGYAREVEPNGTTVTATPIASTNAVVYGTIFPIGDVDFFSFSAQAGDRVYLATMTASGTSPNTDSQVNLLQSDGTTLVEFDDDDGSLSSASSSIAGVALPTAGTYYVRLNQFNNNNTLRPYELHFRLQSGTEAPAPEVEGNDTPGTANPLPANGWVSGARNPAVATEQDWYSFTANAGDTVFLNLDLDPERDNVQWNGRLGIALFGDAANQILVVDDASTGSATNPLSEALFMTIKTAGTYFAFVDSASPTTGGPTATYTLSVSIHPAAAEGVNCTTYTSTDVPKTIGPTPGLVSSTITVPGNPRIADLDVEVQLNHTLMQDIDAHLRSPAGNDIGLFTDIGVAVTGGQAQMDTVFDDEAGIAPAFTVLKNLAIKPESAYRLSWLDGEDAGGTWTLDLRDDTNNASGGTLTGWSLRICEVPPPPACAPGFVAETVFSTDFEAGAAGFTHSGTADEWELGLPATAATTTTNPVAAFNTCASGTNCWKTDLDNTYNISSAQDLLSPNVNLAGYVAPVVVSWAQRYQMESATFDHYFVDAQQAGGASPVRLHEWLDATMTDGPGNPAVNLGASSGWSRMRGRADSLAGLNSELRFHLDSDNTINFAGVAIDDVAVTACRAASADLSITKTDGVTTATPGGSLTYTITASNAGVDGVSGATVADTFPASLTCNWTCVGAGGGTCTAGPAAGDINDSVNLPSGASVTYTASCTLSASATGSLSNTATVASTVGDPVPGNNSATDTDTILASADLAITKTDGIATATPGGSTTYTIVASNAGPSSASSATVADTFPATLTCNWTCVGAGGGTCTAGPVAGNINDAVNLPAGALVTYTASCTISASATGSLANTATVASATSDPDPANNSATDTDTLTPDADVSTSQTDDLDPVGVHRDVTYTVTIGNAGPSDASTVTLVDALPEGATFVSSTPGSPTCTESAGTLSCSLGDLAAGGSTNVSVVLRTLQPGGLSNMAQGNSATPDSVPTNNSSTQSTSVLFYKGDLDNDLQTDLFLANTTTNVHRVWTMNGVTLANDTAFNPQAPAESSQRAAGVDDFGGDYRNDLVFWNSATGAVEFWMLNGVDRQGAPIPLSGAPALALNWKLSATADFNSDLKPDLVWRNSVSQKIVIWTMNGTNKEGSMIPTPDLAVNSNWEIVGARDLNGDGFTDLLWYNPDSGKIVYWWLDGSAVRTTGNFTVPPNAGNNNWKVLAMGDYGIGPSGVPGTVDIVWRNQTSGNFVVWHMDLAGNRTAGGFTSPAAPATTPLEWTIVGPR